jgi:hypothetical protein
MGINTGSLKRDLVVGHFGCIFALAVLKNVKIKKFSQKIFFKKLKFLIENKKMKM